MHPAVSLKNNIPVFAAKLLDINTATLPINDYSKRYLHHLITHRFYYLQIYTHVLDLVLQHSGKTAKQITLVDYGAGNGLLGMFAKFCGFKKIFICDMDAAFVHASKITSLELNIKINDFITGDVEILKAALQKETIDAITGTDVIEHIYNLDDFFKSLSEINRGMLTVFTTASNPSNFIKTRQLKKLQLKDEWHGSDPSDFLLAGAEKHEAFFEIRKIIIEQNFPGLQRENILALGKATRGMNQPDIITAVQAFLKTGNMPMPDKLSLNTCNPYSGSWTERILTVQQYKDIYARHGFTLQAKNGFYNAYSPGFKKYVNKILNGMVKITGRFTAPFITLIGYKNT